jgi:hypothetical protein
MPNRQLPRLLSGQVSNFLPFLADFACDRLCIVCIRDSAVEQISAPVSGKMLRFAVNRNRRRGLDRLCPARFLLSDPVGLVRLVAVDRRLCGAYSFQGRSGGVQVRRVEVAVALAALVLVAAVVMFGVPR